MDNQDNTPKTVVARWEKIHSGWPPAKIDRGPESAVIIDHVCHVLVSTDDFNECENCSLFKVCFKNRRSLCKILHGEREGYHYEIMDL